MDVVREFRKRLAQKRPRGTKVQVLPRGTTLATATLEDLEYFQKMLLKGLSIPKNLLDE